MGNAFCLSSGKKVIFLMKSFILKSNILQEVLNEDDDQGDTFYIKSMALRNSKNSKS